MAVYALAQLSIADRATYSRYQERFLAMLRQFKCTVLAADEHPQVVEGQWGHEKVVLLSFPDEDSFWELARSPQYEEVARDRRAASSAVVLLVQGVPGTRG
jgi:uncharacterized protein (DUF1330 family)